MKAELIEDVIEKIVVLKYPDGSTKYALHLSNGQQVIMKVDRLMSVRLSMGSITDVAGLLYVFPNQKGWLCLIRKLLERAEEKRTTGGCESDMIMKILAEWSAEWDEQENLDLAVKISESCVVKSDTLFFNLPTFRKKLSLRKVKLTRTLLCKLLKELGARRTNPVKRFGGLRIRTWQIPVFYILPWYK